MKTLLKKIYHVFLKKEKTKKLIRKIYCRMCIIKNMLKKDVFVPFVPIEHFYSPFPAIVDIRNFDFEILPAEISGIDLHTDEQFELLNKFEPFYLKW
ncbi:MAG: hypothetical protein LBT14_04385 [Treponema sp.]|jgi:hypothetical protein|nr:hypothetical protein [Treponema sp.]